jgi:hypothetical protein
MLSLSQNESLREPINLFYKLLKTKLFISQKSLDTPLFRLIRFRQKVLTDFAPLELFSLKEKAAPLPGRSFYLGSVVNLPSSVFSTNKI